MNTLHDIVRPAQQAARPVTLRDAQRIIAAGGERPDGPRVVRVIAFGNAWGGDSFALITEGEDRDFLLRPGSAVVRNPRVLWDAPAAAAKTVPTTFAQRAAGYRAHMESLPAKHAAEHAEWLALTDDERAWASMSPYERAAQARDEAMADQFGSEG